jgi:glycogen debranching enzyme
MYVVHPWEAGNDHAPRWDDWGAPGRTKDGYSRPARTAWNKERMNDVSFAADGAAEWSTSFVACPAAFNAYTAFNFRELAAVTGDGTLEARADELADAMDARLWDEEERLWSDHAVVGGGPSVRTPISDGVMGALVTADREKAQAALRQLNDPVRFGAPFGPANVARSHPAYDPDTYWRGPAWPPLNYLFQLALKRFGMMEESTALAALTEAGAVASGWAEYWNPENGRGLGAVPQSWAGLVIAMRP